MWVQDPSNCDEMERPVALEIFLPNQIQLYVVPLRPFPVGSVIRGPNVTSSTDYIYLRQRYAVEQKKIIFDSDLEPDAVRATYKILSFNGDNFTYTMFSEFDFVDGVPEIVTDIIDPDTAYRRSEESFDRVMAQFDQTLLDKKIWHEKVEVK